MEYLLFEDSDFYKNPNKLDILGLCFYADPEGNQVKFKFLAEIISKYLERYIKINFFKVSLIQTNTKMIIR